MKCCFDIPRAKRKPHTDGPCSECPHKDNPEYMTVRQILVYIAKKIQEVSMDKP